MHIPKGASQTCALLTFDDALHCTRHDDYDAARWLYVPPYYTEYRYILGTRGENPLICIGINPSTAQPGDLDNTLKSVERIALGNGYDSFTMFNVYPQRATDPNAMDTTFNRALHEQNMAAFRYVLGQYAPGQPAGCVGRVGHADRKAAVPVRRARADARHRRGVSRAVADVRPPVEGRAPAPPAVSAARQRAGAV